MRLLPKLDPVAIESDPKVFVGFSDLTALLIYLMQQCRMGVFHGPTLTSTDLSKDPQSRTARSLYGAVMEGGKPESLSGESWAGGTATGTLAGGNLSLITALLGTPYALFTGGAILFIEDVNEPLYRIDRMLNQLRLAGMTDNVRGVALGSMIKPAQTEKLKKVIADVFDSSVIPIVSGFPSGHDEVNATLPLGSKVKLDGDLGKLEFIEANNRKTD